MEIWRGRLAEGGAIAFSHPVWMREPPSEAASSFWAEYPEIDGMDAMSLALDDAGWDIVGGRWVVGAAWKAYYAPMEARIAKLRAGQPNGELLAAIEANEAEIARWRTASDEIAYRLTVVRPR